MIIDIAAIDYAIRFEAASCILSKARRICDSGKKNGILGKIPQGWVKSGDGSNTYINAKTILKGIKMYDAALALLDERDGNAHCLLNWQAIEYRTIGMDRESRDNYLKIIEYAKIIDENGQSVVSKPYLDLALQYVTEYDRTTSSAHHQDDEFPEDIGSVGDDDPKDDAIGFALEFAEQVAAGNFDVAFEMLHDTIKGELSPGKIENLYRQMVTSPDIAATSIVFENAIDEWPQKEANDLKWCYLSVTNGEDCEAIAVIVTKVQDKMLIREIEWGRP